MTVPKRFTAPRRNDWSIRLAEYLAECRIEHVEFEWDGLHCVSFSCGAIEAMTGTNPFDDYDDSFSTPLGAAKVIKDAGCETLDELVGKIVPRINNPNYVNRGDLAMVRSPLSDDAQGTNLVMPNALGICEPPYIWVLSNVGVISVPLSEGESFYSVGRGV